MRIQEKQKIQSRKQGQGKSSPVLKLSLFLIFPRQKGRNFRNIMGRKNYPGMWKVTQISLRQSGRLPRCRWGSRISLGKLMAITTR